MLTRWLTVTLFLAGSACPEKATVGWGSLTVAPTCRVKGRLEEEMTLNCGDGKSTGVVQYWHTPFGKLQTPSLHSKQDPVFMQHDGSLVVHNASILHSGLYYCFLKHTEGTTLWPYKLHVGPNNQKDHDHNKYEQHSSCDALRLRKDVGSKEERQADVSDGHFAGAVAASVLLTFVLGFSAGALTRTHVLRCLGAVTTRLRSPRKERRQTVDGASEVTMTTLPPLLDSQTFEMEQVRDDDSLDCATMESTISSTTSFPPAKPQRSFRNKPDEKEMPAYLEGCDFRKEDDRRMEKEAPQRSLEEKNEGCNREEEAELEEEEEESKFSGFYLLGEEEGSRTETDEDESSQGVEEKDGGSREEEKEWRQGEEVEEAGEQENMSKEYGEEGTGSEEEVGGDEEKGTDKRDEEEWGEKEGDGEKREEDGETDSMQLSSKTEEDETESRKQEDTINNRITGEEREASSSRARPGRRSRIIRLYQYDEDGQRYCHLPNPAPDEPGPAPRLKQRSLSLTRLNAIMAAASAGPLDTTETRREETEERPHFHMEI